MVEKENGAEMAFEEIMAKNLLNLAKDTNLRIQDADWTPAGYTQNYSHQETS